MADLDPERVHKAQGRLPSASIKVGNCNSWLFGLIDEPFSIADFDAYSNPYPAFVSFWLLANKANRIILFGTDGQRQRIKRSKCTKRLPDGAETPATMIEYRTQYNFWWKRFVLPFLEITIAPYRIIRSVFYIRQDMLYWGVVASL